MLCHREELQKLWLRLKGKRVCLLHHRPEVILSHIGLFYRASTCKCKLWIGNQLFVHEKGKWNLGLELKAQFFFICLNNLVELYKGFVTNYIFICWKVYFWKRMLLFFSSNVVNFPVMWWFINIHLGKKFGSKFRKFSCKETFMLIYSVHFVSEDDAAYPDLRTSSIRSQFTSIGNSFAEDHEADGMCHLIIRVWFRHCLIWYYTVQGKWILVIR